MHKVGLKLNRNRAQGGPGPAEGCLGNILEDSSSGNHQSSGERAGKNDKSALIEPRQA